MKSWVTQWDFLRLYPGEECEIEVSSWKPSYEEPQEVPEVQLPEPNHSLQLADVHGVPPSIPGEETELLAPAITWASEQLGDDPGVPPSIPAEETELAAPTITWASESSKPPTS